MATNKIEFSKTSNLQSADTLSGDEFFRITQDGNDRKVTIGTLLESPFTATKLTGVTAVDAPISAQDNPIEAFGKLQGQLNNTPRYDFTGVPQRDYAHGTLIKTDIPTLVENASYPYLLEIKANNYGFYRPCYLLLQGYSYSNEVSETMYTAYAAASVVTGDWGCGDIKIFSIDNKICFWFARGGYWQGFDVRCNHVYLGDIRNRVVSITDEAFPTAVAQGTVSVPVQNDGRTYTLKSHDGRPAWLAFINASGAERGVAHTSDDILGFTNTSGNFNAYSSDNGDFTILGSLVQSSDSRLKSNLVEVDNALEKLETLTGYTYNLEGSDNRNVGLIAQDVQSVLPEAVFTVASKEGEESYLGVAYGNLIALLVNAIKELKAEVDALKGN